MRLIDVASMKLVQFFDDSQIPGYGILSHRWGSEELTLQEYQKMLVKLHPGYDKIKKFCQKVAGEGLKYAWIDTCCIDKTSSAELSESINSMFTWYRKASVCFVYLADVTLKDVKLISIEEVTLYPHLEQEFLAKRSTLKESMSQSAWFTRGWTLQELLAPRNARFYDADWQYFGTKLDLKDILASRTGIEQEYLSVSDFETVSIAKRMSWASERETTRVEDMAYCLLGIFSVNMPLLYGEGTRAFTRLQEEIMKDNADHSLFAWTASRNSNYFSRQSPTLSGPLASSPGEFAYAGNVVPYPDLIGNSPYAMTNQGLRIDIPIYPYPKQAGLWLGILGCYDRQVERPLAILLQRVNSRAAESTQAHQYGRFTIPRAPIPVTPDILSKAEVRTIYLRKIAIARSHDKEYSFNLRFAKPVFSTNHGPLFGVKLVSSHPDYEVLAEKDTRLEWRASLASNSPGVGALCTIKDNNKSTKFLICLAVTQPETYVHELDRWLRSRCTCKLVAGRSAAGVLDKMSSERMNSYISEAYNGNEQGLAPSVNPRTSLFAVVRKEFEDGRKVIAVDFDFIKSYEVETIERPVELNTEKEQPLEPATEQGQGVEPEAGKAEAWPQQLEATMQSRIDAYATLMEFQWHHDPPDTESEQSEDEVKISD